MPYAPRPDDGGQPYETETYWEHITAHYGHMTLEDVYDLCAVDFMFLRREAFIVEMSKTDDGRKYLREAWTLEQTEPDREGLRELRRQLGGGGRGRKH